MTRKKSPARPSQALNDDAPWNDPTAPWYPVPEPADAFTCRKTERGNWTRMQVPDEKGEIMIETFPLEDLDIGLMRERWGAGSYQLNWIGDRDGRRTSVGTCKTFTILHKQGDELPEDELEPSEDELEPPLAGGQGGVYDPLTQALNMMAMITNLKNAEVSASMKAFDSMQGRAIEMAGMLFNREERKEQNGAGQMAMQTMMQEMARSLQATQQALQLLAGQVAELKDDEDKPRGVDLAGGIQMQPGDSFGDVATAAVANGVAAKLPDIIDGLASAAKGWGEAKSAEAEKTRRQYPNIDAAEKRVDARKAAQSVNGDVTIQTSAPTEGRVEHPEYGGIRPLSLEVPAQVVP